MSIDSSPKAGFIDKNLRQRLSPETNYLLGDEFDMHEQGSRRTATVFAGRENASHDGVSVRNNFDIIDVRNASVDESGRKMYGDRLWAPGVQYIVTQPETYVDADSSKKGYMALRAGDVFEIGRESSKAEKVFELPDTVSRKHISFRVSEHGRLEVADLNSSNGTNLVRYFYDGDTPFIEEEHNPDAHNAIFVQDISQYLRNLGSRAIDGRDEPKRQLDIDVSAAFNFAQIVEANSDRMQVKDIDKHTINAFAERLKRGGDTVAPSIEAIVVETNFQPTRGIEIDGREIFLSSMLHTGGEGSERPYVIGYTKNDESGAIVPRCFYKSNSDGGWRVSPAYMMGRLDKGTSDLTSDLSDFGGYVQMTKLPEALNKILNEETTQNPIRLHDDEEILDHFSIHKLYGENAKVDSYLSATCEKVSGGKDLDVCLPGSGFDSFGMDMENVREKLGKVELPKGFEPDFDRGSKYQYDINHTIAGNAVVRVYDSVYMNENVQWHMAADESGRVWVDKLLYEDNSLTDYGTYSRVIVAGVVNLKPFEYDSQVSGAKMGVDVDRYNSDYVDMRKTIDKLPWIQKFRKANNIQ
ncbi:MAG: FHA domain-containing protein [Chloroflexi bacterium]|nr:MAG: FHA domain-containing protein [Chloroflexota bacterium]